MEAPKPTEEHKRMERLAGYWTGEEKMPPSPWAPEGVVATGHTKGRVGLDGFAVIVDYHQENEGRTTFTGHGVYTFDPKQNCIVLYWFDCMGGTPNLYKGNFDGDLLTLVSDESTEGGPRYSRLVYDLSEPGKMTSKMEVSQDGKAFKSFMEARYHLKT